MPSGARKRKAAKRRKEMGQMAPRLADPPQGHHDGPIPPEESKESDGGSPTSSSSSSSPSRGNHHPRSAEEFFGSEAVVINSVAESGKGAALAGEDEDEDESAAAVKEVACAFTAEPLTTPEISVVELAKSEKEEEKPVEESAVPVETIVALAEEGRHADEVAAKVLEETSVEPREKVVPLPDVDADGDVKQRCEGCKACCVARKAETLPMAEIVPHVPVAVHHAKWWNCCGLLDVFAGSGR